MGRTCTITTALLLTACNPALRGGTYTIEVTAVENDSCDLWGDALGYTDDGSIWWESGDTMVLATTAGEWWWTWDGEELTYQADTTEPLDDTCDMLFYEDFVGRIVDSNHLTYSEHMETELQGTCADWNVDLFPCTVDIEYAGERTGD